MAGLPQVISQSPRLFGVPCWYLPILAGSAWLLTLLSMLFGWLSTGSPHYSEMYANQQYAYISDVGASFWGKPLFVTGSCLTVGIFGLAYGLERWLRHTGQLLHVPSRSSTAMTVLGSLFTLAGAIGLVILSIFDLKRHMNIHFVSLGVFIMGYLLAATMMAFEKRRLSRKFPENTLLQRSFCIKFFFIVSELILAAFFGTLALFGKVGLRDGSVIVEWILSLMFVFYIWSFAIDFFPVPTTPRNFSLASDDDNAKLVKDPEKLWNLDMLNRRRSDAVESIASWACETAKVQKPALVVPKCGSVRGGSMHVYTKKVLRVEDLEGSEGGKRRYSRLQ